MEKKTDLRIIKTRLALHNAFTDLVEKKLFEDISVNELCNAAMIRRTTFYKYFSDKYDYFIFYISEIMEESKNAVSPDVIYENPIEFTEKRIYTYLEFIRQHQKFINNLKKSSMVAFLYQSIQQQVEAELRHILINVKHCSPSTELDVSITLYAGGLIATIGWWIDHPDTFSDKEIARLLVENIIFPQVH